MPISFGAGGKSTPKRKSSQISLPVTDSLVAYFDANNPNSYPGAGNVWQDLTSRNQSATVNTSITSFANRYGGHLVMTQDGVNTPAYATLSSALVSNTVTFMAWVNPSATQSAYAGIIIDRSIGNFGTGIQFNSGGATGLAIIWNGTNYNFNTGITVPPNKWSLVSFVVTPTTITPYLNGTAGNVLTGTFSAVSCANPRLGWDNGAARVFQGKYGAALIYNKSLSAAEISSMYDFFKTRYVVADSNLKLHIDAADSASYSGSGTTVSDISGSGIAGTLTSGASYSSFNNSFNFDGVDDYISIAHNAALNVGQSFSISAWIKADRLLSVPFSNDPGARQVIYSTRQNSDTGCWQLELTGNRLAISGIGTWIVASNGTLKLNAWHHVCYVRDGSGSGSLYIDGVLQTAYTDAAVPTPVNNYTFADNSSIKLIGRGAAGTQPFDGKIAQLQVYNKALTQAEISQSYNSSRSIFYPTDFPANISGLQLWLRGDSGVYDANGELITADNTAVASWEDRSGSSNKFFTQTTSTQRPVLRTGANGVNGLPVLSFDGVDDELFSATNPTPTSNFSYFAVIKPMTKTGFGFNSRFCGRISGADGFNWGCTTTNFYAVIRNAAGTGPDINWGTSQAFSSPILSSVIMDSTKTALRINKNEIGTSTRTSWASAGTTEYIGSDGVTTSSRFQGHICEILVFNRALSGKELNMVENYLASKWGITKAVEKEYDGLVASYSASDTNSYSGSGTTLNDLTGNANTGTLTNLSSSNGLSFYFNRASSQAIPVSTLTNIPTGNSSASIELWYKHAGLNQDCGLVGWGTYGANYSVHALRTINVNGLRFYGWGGDLDTASNVLTVNTWHHIVAIYNSNTQTKQVYVNGSLVQTLTGVAAHSVTANNFYIARTNALEYGQGDISTVKIYNRALSADEISLKYRETQPIYSAYVNRTWVHSASSSDGTKLIAADNAGYLYTSTDSGANWTARMTDATRSWNAVGMSPDGTKMVAVTYSGTLGAPTGKVYTSSDGGVSWTERTGAGSKLWTGAAISSDGTKLLIAGDGGPVYTSADSGATWTQRIGNNWYRKVASSQDGTKLVVLTAAGGPLITSADSGATWTNRTSITNWVDVACSSDGTKLVASQGGNSASNLGTGYIYTSTDSGATWTTQSNSSGLRIWQGVACDSTGTKLAAVVYTGFIYTSADGGATWTERTSSGSRKWRSISSSSDGVNLVAVVEGDQIYTSNDSGATWKIRK